MRKSGTQAPELTWPGKTKTRRRDVHPLLLLESHPAETPLARGGPPAPEGGDCGGLSGDPSSPAWTNLLVRADNRPLLSSLLASPLREAIDAAGGIRLVYSDPPFAAGMDFPMTVSGVSAAGRGVGREEAAEPEDSPPAIDALAYSDTWDGGLSAFLDMMHERLLLLHDLLAPGASLFLHCDYRMAPSMRLLLDEVFGRDKFLGDIVWHYTGGGRAGRWFSRKHDRILHYALSDHWTFNLDAVRVPYKPGSGYAKNGIVSAVGKRYLPHPGGTPVDDVWDIPMLNPLARERTGYPTQKPEALLERILLAASNPGDLVADIFCGSGVTAAVAERLGRKWLAVDSSPLAVHTTRKRLLDLPARFPFAVAELGPRPRAAKKATKARGRPGETVFTRAVRLPEGEFVYTIRDIRLACRAADGGVSLVIAGFAVIVHAPASAPGMRASGALQRLQRLSADWRYWLDYWSIALEPDGPAEAPLPTGEKNRGAFRINRVLWRGFRDRGRGSAPFASSPLPPDCAAESGGNLLVTFVDIFANTVRFNFSLKHKEICPVSIHTPLPPPDDSAPAFLRREDCPSLPGDGAGKPRPALPGIRRKSL